ncbi:hypothetical protein [Xanthobacter wiegelii]|uniref:hypothetical protein n=1 Tax=Xanthobacter wiegelii TaxID=3119913 RepID=UPI0037299EC6
MITKLYEEHVEGCLVQKGHTKALHVVVQFPTELIDGRDATYMLHHARAFAETVFGTEAIFHDRVDRDEKSMHVVDLMVAPRYLKVTKRKSQLAISTSRHLKQLAISRNRSENLRGQGRALQDAWFAYMRDVMMLEGVKRGEKKKRPGDDWKTPEELAAEADRKAAEQELEAARLKHEEVQRILEAPPPEIPTIVSPTFSERLAPDRWLAEQNFRLAEAAGLAAVRMAASDHERRRLAAELDQARIFSASVEKISRERDLARMKADRMADDLKAERAASARLKAERADALRKAEALAAEVRDILETPALDLVEEVAPELGLSSASPFHLAEDGRRFVLDAESWEEPADDAQGLGAISLVMQVLRVRFDQAIRWLTERFGLGRVQAEIAAVVDMDAPAPGGDAPRRPGF